MLLNWYGIIVNPTTHIMSATSYLEGVEEETPKVKLMYFTLGPPDKLK